MSRNAKRKKWHDYRCKKLREKKNKRHRGEKSTRVNSNPHAKRWVSKAPKEFSLFANHDEVAKYFSRILGEIKDHNFGEHFIFDFSEVENVAIESIIYAIAVLRNIRGSKALHYKFEGNFPKNADAKSKFENSGFLKYVKTQSIIRLKPSDNIQIQTGDKVDTIVAKKILDFATDFGITKWNRELYSTIIELMTNTVQHAYQENEIFKHAWYIYCEHTCNGIAISFIDIGEGIPHTIARKNLLEKVTLSDSDAILSAFNGEYRSETNMHNRGKGLPDIRKYIEQGAFENFRVLSDKGECSFDYTKGRFVATQHGRSVIGTVYTWEMKGE